MSYTGNWNVTMQTPMGNRDLSLELSEDGGALSGTASADGNSNAISNGRVEGGKAMFEVSLAAPDPAALAAPSIAQARRRKGSSSAQAAISSYPRRRISR